MGKPPVKGAATQDRTAKALAMLEKHYCETQKSSFCSAAKVLTANFKAAQNSGNMKKYQDSLTKEHDATCKAGMPHATAERCKALKVLLKAYNPVATRATAASKAKPPVKGAATQDRTAKALAMLEKHYCETQKSSFC